MDQTISDREHKDESRFSVERIPPIIFWICFVIAIGAAAMDRIPDSLLGALALALILGVGLNWIGSQIPILNQYGAGPIMAVIVPAALIQVHFFPESIRAIEKNFFNGYDFASFLVAGILVGSVLAIPRRILLQIGIRFVIPLVLNLIGTLAIIGGLGAALGYGFANSVILIAGPVMGAGISAGAVPLSEIYAGISGEPPSEFLTTMTSSVIIANLLTILTAAILGGRVAANPDKPFKGFAGMGGRILRIKGTDNAALFKDDTSEDQSSNRDLLSGFIIVSAAYLLSILANALVPMVHEYVWLVCFCLVAKFARLLPESVADRTGAWSSFMAAVMVPAVLSIISMAVLDLGALGAAVTDPLYLALCIATVVVACLLGGALTYLFGFFFFEGSIVAGIGLADMGGTGDVAVLTAAKRMSLLPFATICTRLAGALNLIIMTAFASLVL